MLKRTNLAKSLKLQTHHMLAIYASCPPQPVRSSKYRTPSCPSTSQVTDLSHSHTPTLPQIHSKHDLIVWFEILELASSGEYVPVLVDHSDDLACRYRRTNLVSILDLEDCF